MLHILDFFFENSEEIEKKKTQLNIPNIKEEKGSYTKNIYI